MIAYKRVLCPTDFSEFSEYSVRYANAIAKEFGSEIHCVHVVDFGVLNEGPVDGVYATTGDLHLSQEAMKDRAQKEMDSLVKKEHFMGTEVTPHIRTGHAAEEIVAMAEEIDADLIVIATHGRSGLSHLVFGSTCDKVLRLSKAPVLALRQPAAHDPLGVDGQTISIGTIMCPLDFSEFSHTALPVAEEWARRFGAGLVLTHVVDARFDYAEWTAQAAMNNSQVIAKNAEIHLNGVAKEIKDLPVEAHVEIGVPHKVIGDLAERQNVGLIVMPTHGRKGIAHVLLGSVAERIIRHVTCPVLVIRP